MLMAAEFQLQVFYLKRAMLAKITSELNYMISAP